MFRRAGGERWGLTLAAFAAALEASARNATKGGAELSAPALERYLTSLHLDDLALACACAQGIDSAWEHFVLQQRPLLYKAADALDPSGGARDLADSLYADLFGLRERDGERASLFRYFHGRSTLTTWLRAVLAQRHVDRHRANRRLDALPDDESPAALPAPAREHQPERARYLRLIELLLTAAVAALAPRDRLRLACYYAQELTLAQTGRLLAEHEATTSRQLAKTRKALREEVERQLQSAHGLNAAEVDRCFESVSADAGPLDLARMLTAEGERKESALNRSS